MRVQTVGLVGHLRDVEIKKTLEPFCSNTIFFFIMSNSEGLAAVSSLK